MNKSRHYIHRKEDGLIYRLHITCRAGHTTYTDYKTKRSANKNLEEMSDPTGWYATHITVVVEEYFERVDGMWNLVTIVRPNQKEIKDELG